MTRVNLTPRRTIVPAGAPPFASGPDDSPDYDVAYCARLRAAGWQLRADWTVEPAHLGAPTPVPA